MSSQTKIHDDMVHLPNAPAIPGLNFRRFRGEIDYPHMLAVINDSKEADGIERTETLENITRNYEYILNCDPYQDVLIAEVSGEVIGYNRVFWEKLDDGTYTYTVFGFLLPAWRRRGIGRSMLRHGEQRLREIAANHLADGPRFFQSWAADTEVGTIHLLLSEGYQPVRFSYEMVRDLNAPISEAPMPEGLEIRPVETEHLWLIYDARNEAFRDH
jgi:mycothiol synthase